MAVVITATLITSRFPPRVTVTVTGMTVGDRVRIYRIAGGKRVQIRGGFVSSTDFTSMVVTDSEMPFGTNVRWMVRINEQSSSFEDYNSNILNIGLPGNKVLLSDAITDQSAETEIVAWERTKYESDSTLFRVGRKNLVVSGEGRTTGQWTADVRFLTRSISSKNSFLNLVASATSGVLQLRYYKSDGKLDEGYISFMSYDVERFSDDIEDERRFIVANLAQTDSWPYAFHTTGFTYQDLIDLYDGQTYADLELDYPTYLDLMKADLG